MKGKIKHVPEKIFFPRDLRFQRKMNIKIVQALHDMLGSICKLVASLQQYSKVVTKLNIAMESDLRLYASVSTVSWVIKFINVWWFLQQAVNFGSLAITAFGFLLAIAYGLSLSLHLAAMVFFPEETQRWMAYFILGIDLLVLIFISMQLSCCGKIMHPSETFNESHLSEVSHLDLGSTDRIIWINSACLNPSDPPPSYDDVESPPPTYDSLFSMDKATTEMVSYF